MLYTEQSVRDNIRTRDGKRVFYLGSEDRLTAAAKDYLCAEGIPVLPASQAKPSRFRLAGGGYVDEKPEHMTHLHSDLLVPKSHPRILFRGKLDTLEAALLQAGATAPKLIPALEELLQAVRRILRSEVLDQPLEQQPLLGLTEQELRRHSHTPQEYYGQPHFMPGFRDTPAILQLNLLRCLVREAELAASAAFGPEERQDLQRMLNRLSSAVYILMIREKAAGG